MNFRDLISDYLDTLFTSEFFSIADISFDLIDLIIIAAFVLLIIGFIYIIIKGF